MLSHIGVDTGEQLVLGPEVVIDETTRNPGLFAYLVYGKRRHATLSEACDPRLDQVFATIQRRLAAIGDFPVFLVQLLLCDQISIALE